MSFAVWRTKPPFTEADLRPGEAIFTVGEFWVVTDRASPTLAQVEAFLNPPNAAIDAQIRRMEEGSGGYVRGIREFMLAMAQVTKDAGGPDFMLNKGMQNVKALDDQIRALRAQRV